jgi:ribosomal protein L13
MELKGKKILVTGGKGFVGSNLIKELQKRIPCRIVEEAVWGMLPKRVLGRNYYRRLHVYVGDQIQYKKTKDGSEKIIDCLKSELSDAELFDSTNWIKVTL